MHAEPTLLLKDEESPDELDFLFGTFYKARRPMLMPIDKGWRPLTDVYETEEELVIVMDIAGISVNDIRLTLLGNILTIRGIRRERPNDERRHFHKMEVDFGPFERRIEIPARIDPDRATRAYFQGFLEIRLPKEAERRLPTEIEIDL